MTMLPPPKADLVLVPSARARVPVVCPCRHMPDTSVVITKDHVRYFDHDLIMLIGVTLPVEICVLPLMMRYCVVGSIY